MTESPNWPWDEALDAVVAAPESHHIVLENETVRVVDVLIPPGQREPVHTHKSPSVMIVDSSARIIYYDANGSPAEYQRRDVSPEDPYIEWLGPEGPHAVENIDTVIYHARRIEIKQKDIPLG